MHAGLFYLLSVDFIKIDVFKKNGEVKKSSSTDLSGSTRVQEQSVHVHFQDCKIGQI